MKTIEEIITETMSKPASDRSARPPRIAYVEFTCAELKKSLTPRRDQHPLAAKFLAGLERVGTGNVIVVREDLLIAIGAIPGDADLEKGAA
jgi:hypothetical protein